MPFVPSTRRTRETIVVVCLAVIFGTAIFLFCWLVLGAWFLALLATFAVVFLIGLGHYFFWGRRLQDTTTAQLPSHRIETGSGENGPHSLRNWRRS
jgi:heme O synthase-like polyprenyltransferase